MSIFRRLFPYWADNELKRLRDELLAARGEIGWWKDKYFSLYRETRRS